MNQTASFGQPAPFGMPESYLDRVYFLCLFQLIATLFYVLIDRAGSCTKDTPQYSEYLNLSQQMDYEEFDYNRTSRKRFVSAQVQILLLKSTVPCGTAHAP